MLCKRSVQKNFVKSKRSRKLWSALKKGRLDPRLLPELWHKLNEAERGSVFAYMLHFGHCCQLPGPTVDACYIVPTLLPAAPAGGTSWSADEAKDERLLVRCIHLDGDWSDQSSNFCQTPCTFVSWRSYCRMPLAYAMHSRIFMPIMLSSVAIIGFW